MLYVKVIRAIYGCIESALQWYKLFTNTLKKKDFLLNQYDKCVTNKIIKNKQCTITWHVDDCLASHVNQQVLDQVGKMMIEEFGEMEITRGNEHDFLGMKLKFDKSKKTIQIDMRKQINEVI